MKYTKIDLSKKFREFSHIRLEDSHKLINLVLASLRKILVNMKTGDTFEIRGLGVFRMITTKEDLNARNPKTGDKVSVPSRRRLLFGPSKTIKRELLEVK